jgi:hypothetical protein
MTETINRTTRRYGGFAILIALLAWLVPALCTLGCDAMLDAGARAAFPEAAAQVDAEDQAAAKLADARYMAEDGYERVNKQEFLERLQMRQPAKMKFCERWIQKVGPELKQATKRNPELFDTSREFYFPIAGGMTFASLPVKEKGAFEKTANRHVGMVCLWSDGAVRHSKGGGDVTVYPLAKWDGVRDEDVAAAKSEVAAKTPSAESASPKSNPELPPADDEEK